MEKFKKYGWVILLFVIPITVTVVTLLYKFLTKPMPTAEAITDIPDTSNDSSMNDVIQFIKSHEGGYVNNPNDSGGETNKGITYSTWCSFFGSNSHDRFIAMSDDDWYTVFKSGYWDKISGDSINSAMIANFLVDWFWGSGGYAIGMKYFGVEYGVQAVLKSMGSSLSIDASIGPKTLEAINSADTDTLYQGLKQNRQDFYNAIAANSPKDRGFLAGWTNRLNDMIAINS